MTKEHVINKKKVSIQYFKTKQGQCKDKSELSEVAGDESVDYSSFPQSANISLFNDGPVPLRFNHNMAKQHMTVNSSAQKWLTLPVSTQNLKAINNTAGALKRKDISPIKIRRYKDFYSSLRRNNPVRASAMSELQNLVFRQPASYRPDLSQYNAN